MKHQKKIKLASRMISKKERSEGKSIFDSNEWNKRKEAIRGRVQRKIAAVKARKEIRLKKLKT